MIIGGLRDVTRAGTRVLIDENSNRRFIFCSQINNNDRIDPNYFYFIRMEEDVFPSKIIFEMKNTKVIKKKKKKRGYIKNLKASLMKISHEVSNRVKTRSMKKK